MGWFSDQGFHYKPTYIMEELKNLRRQQSASKECGRGFDILWCKCEESVITGILLGPFG